MKKIITLLLITLIFSCVSKPTILTSSEDIIQNEEKLEKIQINRTPIPGEYAIYRNKFKDQNIITSIFFIGNDNYVIRTQNLVSDEKNQFQLNAKIIDGQVDYGDLKVNIGDFNSTDSRTAHVDFLNMFSMFDKSDFADYPNEIISEDKWDNYSLYYNFKYWIPVFNVYNKFLPEQEDNGFKLIRFGILNQDTQDKILDFKGIDTNVDNSPTMIVENKTEKIMTLNGLQLPLDENWSEIEQNTTQINLNGERYSYLNVTSYNKKDVTLNSYEIFAYELKNNPMYILPDTVETFSTYGTPTLQFEVLDEFTKRKTTTVMFVYDQGETLSIVSFGSYTNFYNENKEYFDNILF